MNKAWRAFEADPLEGMAEGPYPGLRPFLPRERDIFFGREQMINQVLVRLNEQHMVVVHGASGCGKSSLIAAGVLPQLARRRARRGLVLRTGTFRPGIQPMQSLVGLLGELCGTDGGPAPVDAVYRAISGGAGAARAGVARLAADAGVDQLCIVIDQFEELFRFAEDEGFEEAQRFADLLVQLCGGGDEEGGWWEAEGAARPAEPVPAEISFILTMRSEFLGNCSRYPGLAEAINRTQYLLPNMSRDDLIRAIREPAEVFEGHVDHALAERMADDARREEDSLPLIQHALMQMWLASDSGRLALADYERALEGSAQSSQTRQKGPLGAILAGHADRVLAETTGGDPAKERAVEFIFRALTRKDSESRAIRFPQRYWRLARLSGLDAAGTRAIVDAFRRDTVSFLTPYEAMTAEIGGESVIDISHEALIRTWPRMSDKAIDANARPVGWIEREAQDAMLWRWLAVHADFYRSNPRAYLDGATTERLSAWFEQIKERPDWVRPYLVRPAGKLEIGEEPEWQAVEKLLKDSQDRTWLDRTMLRRWRKLGRWALLALILIFVAGGVAAFFYFRDRAADNAMDQAEDVVRQGIRATDAFVRTANGSKSQGSPAQTERVDAQTVAQATAGAGGAATGDTFSHAYVWIGSAYAADAGLISNLTDAAGRRVPPGQATVGRGTYLMADNLILRSTAPSEEGRKGPAMGLIARGTPVLIQRLVPVRREGRTEYWARVNFAPGTPVPVRFTFDTPVNGAADDFSRLFLSLGYRPAAAAGTTDLSPGEAEMVYCTPRDRAAALRLATLATRWLNDVPGMQNAAVAPRQADNCTDSAASPLTLRIAFAPSPTAWLNGRWTRDGNCTTPMELTVLARRIRLRGDRESFEIIQSATGDTIITDFASFSRAGQDVNVSEIGTGNSFRMRRCPG
ncbi:MAG TPA: ATP-binding protein [Allosphingosinicella sp.]|nr:ATP-binding protein [Allosphingosinicella sp.]